MRLLFLTYRFPPAPGPAPVRCWNLSRYLVRLGWDVTVLTFDPRLLARPDPSFDLASLGDQRGLRIVHTGLGLRLLLGSWARLRWWERVPLFGRAARLVSRGLGLDEGVGWLIPALRAGWAMRRGDFDLLLATGPPFFSFPLARLLAQHLGLPYVLDYRDLWTLSPHGSTRRWEAPLESWALRRAAGVLVISNAMGDQLRRRFKTRRPPELIRNGFDPGDMARVEPMHFDDIALVYTGMFYPEKRSIAPVLRALTSANARRRPGQLAIRLHYFGRDSDHVRERAAATGALPWVALHGAVGRSTALAAVKGAHAALVITSVYDEGDLSDRGIVTGKLFEAIGLGARIGLIAPTGSEACEIVSRYGHGRHFVGSDVEGMAAWFESLSDAGPRLVDPPDEHTWTAIADRADPFLRSCTQPG